MILLGSTGSIGQNTLAIARRYSLSIEVLVAGTSIDLLNEQIKEFSPKIVVIAHEKDVARVNHTNVRSGNDAIVEAIDEAKSDLVVNALVGFVGMAPTIAALKANKTVALANKESLVAGGAFIDTSKIIPIDSEHFGLWYLQADRDISRMQITASGGAFRDWDIDAIKNATLEDTQKHPNWSMGQKITIDSATMVNKLFELLEARWLFGEGSYDALIETKSIIHALIDFKDGSTTAHIANANMQLPIAYALRGTIHEEILPPVDLVQLGGLEFREISSERYPIWKIKDALLQNPKRGTVINAANEAAIQRFIDKTCTFGDISTFIIEAFEHFTTEPATIEEVYALDREVRAFVTAL